MENKRVIRNMIKKDITIDDMIDLATVNKAKELNVTIFNYALNSKKELQRLIIAILDHFDGESIIQFLGNRIKKFFKKSTAQELEASFNFHEPYQFGYFVKNNKNNTLYLIMDADVVDCLCDGGKSEKKNRIA